MASRPEPKIASPGTTAEPAKKPKKKAAPDVAAITLESLAPGADPSAMIARLCPVDIPGSIMKLGEYNRDRRAFQKINDDAKSQRGVMNATKKELTDKGWEKDAVSWAMKLSEMDPEYAQKVLAQMFVLCRSTVLNVPLGVVGMGVVDGTSVDLFDPDRVYRFGKLNSEGAAPESAAKAETKPQSDIERRADLFENGYILAKKGKHYAAPPGVADPEDLKSHQAGYDKGTAENLGGSSKPPAADNVVEVQRPAAFSTVADEAPPHDPDAIGQ